MAVSRKRHLGAGSVFVRRLAWLGVGFTIVAVIAFAAGSRALLHRQAEQAAMSTARVCAVALATGSGSNLPESTRRLQVRLDDLLAVGSLDVSGRLQTLHPALDAYAPAVALTLAGKGLPVATEVHVANLPQDVWGVIVPLNGVDSLQSQRVVMLLKRDDYHQAWMAATALFVGLMASCSGVVWVLAARWHERHVGTPLRLLAARGVAAAAAAGGASPCETATRKPPGAGSSIETITLHFTELLHLLSESKSRLHRAERDAQWQIRDSEAGFDRKLRRAEDRATIDALTGLRNRAFLDAELEPLFRRQRDSGKNLSVVMLDMDNFKRLNDTLGHQAGDDVLRFVGELLRGAIRPTDFAVRYGGDEFVLLLPDVDDAAARAVAERIVKLFGQYAALVTSDRSLSLSAGVASLGSGDSTAGEALMGDADKALYKAKHSGKNAVATCSTR